MRSQFVKSRLIESAEIVEEGKQYLRVELSGDYYPSTVSTLFEIRWYRNDDFNVHYQEDRQNKPWKCRWDRHPNAHNSRDHFHPPSAASRTDAQDVHWPDDHQDVCHLVMDYLEERIEILWEQR
jgi:hypothetical protein